MKASLWIAAIAALPLAALATPAHAKKASALIDINGERASSAESDLEQRGFKHISTHKNDMGYVYSYWWHKPDRDCINVEVYNGRVETISDAAPHDCGHTAEGHGGNAAAAVGVVAGAALIGALLSHKSHHHEDGNHHSDADAERLYDRGYNDGLHNAPYHNTDRSDDYASGYQAGVSERNANTSHHHGHGGYRAAVDFSDLQDARAAGGTEELGRRGFVQVDNFTSGNTRYGIYWRAASRQCVQVTIADGRLYDLRDIGRHPQCS